MWVRLRFWIAALVRRARFEQEVADELAFHLRARTDEWERRGLSPQAARRRARIELGNIERIKDDHREVRFGGWLARLVQDLRYGCRTLRKRPGITAFGVASLAVGIGTSTFFFSQFNAFSCDRSPALGTRRRWSRSPSRCRTRPSHGVRDLDDTVEGAAAYIGSVPFTVDVDDSAGGGERVFGHHVSPEYFATLGVVPTVGRLLGPETERIGSEPVVVVVSHRFWTRRLDADPRAVGRALRVNGRSAILVGVAAEGFRGVFPVFPADIFVPVTAGAWFARELEGDVLANPEVKWFQVVVRLAAAVSLPVAEAAFDSATRATEGTRLDLEEARRAGRLVSVLPAGRGLPFSLWLTSIVNAMNASAVTLISFEPGLRVDPSVALFTAGLALVAGLVVGLPPALAATRIGPAGGASPLRGGPQVPLYAFRRFGVRNLFIGAQVAVAVTLVVVIGYLVIGDQRWSGIDPGFATDDLALFVIYPGRDGSTPEQLAVMLQDLPERLGSLPEVRHATLADRMPLGAANGGLALADVRATGLGEGGIGDRVSEMVDPAGPRRPTPADSAIGAPGNHGPDAGGRSGRERRRRCAGPRPVRHGLRLRGDLRHRERCAFLGRCPGPVRHDRACGLLRAGVPGRADRSGLDVGGQSEAPALNGHPTGREASVAAGPAQPETAARPPSHRRRHYGDNGSA
ncbi:MAG: permease prefix domain 1-containing protein [Acidobacteria bacterium]|nr:permease prefix domain 1-containing protein [Acidobacteriota bacterium]